MKPRTGRAASGAGRSASGSRPGPVEPSGRGVVLLPVAVLILLSGTATPVEGQLVPLSRHRDVSPWTVGTFFMEVEADELGSDPEHNLLGIRVRYDVGGRSHVRGRIAVPTEDTRRRREGLLGVTFGHALRPFRRDGRGAISYGYELGVVAYDPEPAILAGHADLWGKLRAFGDVDRNMSLGYGAGAWVFGREGAGPAVDLDIHGSVEFTLRPWTLAIDYRTGGNEVFSDEEVLSLSLAWSPRGGSGGRAEIPPR